MEDILLEDENLIQQYQLNVYWSETDHAYIAAMPELPGCLADGPTDAEAKQNIRVTAQEWLDTARLLGRPVPTPAQKETVV